MTYKRSSVVATTTGILFLLLIVAIVSAQDITPTPSDYVELQFTEIRGLSSEQIEGYQTGAGLGYALPAELNGYPGPRHVLDLADELELTETQIAEIQLLWDSPVNAVKDTMAHEVKVTKSIHALVKMARDEGDYASDSFLQWFVDEQVEEEEVVDELIQKLTLIGDFSPGLYLLDRELSTSSPEQEGEI